MEKSLWVIRLLFLILCILGGYAVSEMQPDLIAGSMQGVFIGFGFGGLLIGLDEMLKGFTLRAFSAATFGLLLGSLIAWVIDGSGLFVHVEDERILWLVRLCLFIGFGYIGMVLALRSNKEDMSLVIPYVRLAAQNRPDELLILDTSAIIDGRILDMVDKRFLNGRFLAPRFVLRELHTLSDSADPIKRSKGRRGLEVLRKLQGNRRVEVKIHEGDVSNEEEVDAKLVVLSKGLSGRLITDDYNLTRVAELQNVQVMNLNELARALKPVILPGEVLDIALIREGRDKGQAVGFLEDGTMVVVNEATSCVGKKASVVVSNVLQTGAGIMIFGDLAENQDA